MKIIIANLLMATPIILLIAFSIRHNGWKDTIDGLKLAAGIILSIALLYIGYLMLK